MQGKLYLVATPIGNLEDITLRALRILKEVDVIAAEDTRNTLKILNYFNISKKLISYHRHNEEIKKDEILKILEEGKNVAIVSDAGTPCISDPGEEIVKSAINKNIEIVPIPGACAAIVALISSGLDCKEFVFMGFLPLNKKYRRQKLEDIKTQKKTVIIYEAPHKLKNTLLDLDEILKDREIVLARELTKIHEDYQRGTVKQIIENLNELRGEYVIIIEGAKEEFSQEDAMQKLSLDEHYEYYLDLGLEKKEIIKRIAKDRGVSKNEIYQYFIKQ